MRNLIVTLALLFGVTSVYSQTPEQLPDSVVFKYETKTRQKNFEEFFEKCPPSTADDYTLRSYMESRIILKGDSTRIKFSFNPLKVTKIELETAGSTTREDIKNGMWTAVVKPKTSGYLKQNVYVNGVKSANGMPLFLIFVLEPDEYKEVRAKADECEAKGDLGEFNRYLRTKFAKYYNHQLPMWNR